MNNVFRLLLFFGVFICIKTAHAIDNGSAFRDIQDYIVVLGHADGMALGSGYLAALQLAQGKPDVSLGVTIAALYARFTCNKKYENLYQRLNNQKKKEVHYRYKFNCSIGFIEGMLFSLILNEALGLSARGDLLVSVGLFGGAEALRLLHDFDIDAHVRRADLIDNSRRLRFLPYNGSYGNYIARAA